jgi:hypothetical protein
VLQIERKTRADGMTKVVEHLLCMREALSSSPNTGGKKEKKPKKKKKKPNNSERNNPIGNGQKM